MKQRDDGARRFGHRISGSTEDLIDGMLLITVVREKIKSDIQVICFLREIHRVPWLRYLYFRNVNGAYSGSRNISY